MYLETFLPKLNDRVHFGFGTSTVDNYLSTSKPWYAIFSLPEHAALAAGATATAVPTTSATVAIAETIFFMYCLSCSCVPGQGDEKGNGKGHIRTRRM